MVYVGRNKKRLVSKSNKETENMRLIKISS